jgi:hypothetical protein
MTTSATRVLGAVVGAAVIACASGPYISQRDAVAAAGLYVEGPNAIPPETQARVLGDPNALQLYDDMLMGRRTWICCADSSMMLRWLALSEDPRFLPTFLHYANPDLPVGRSAVFSYASLGLIRLATIPAARQRLIELGRPTTRPEFRKQLVRMLEFRNTAETREILQSMAP